MHAFMTYVSYDCASVTECIKRDFFRKEEYAFMTYVSYDYASLIIYKAGFF